MEFKIKQASKTLNKIIKKTLSPCLNKHFNVSYHDEAIGGLKPPFVILANLLNNWDPFLLSFRIKAPVHFVTSVQQFRNPILRFLLGLAGSIPKTKSMSDSITIRGILNNIKSNRIVGIFPEGKRCWDGQTEEILYPTAKVLKKLNVPVVTVLFQGGYLSFPRWALNHRRGEIHLTYKLLLTTDEISKLSVDEIYDRICKELDINEMNWQAQKMIPFKGKRIAESLELCLYHCPECNSIGRLESHDDTFTCKACGETVRYTPYGYFEEDSGNPRLKTVYDWNQWQLSELEKTIHNRQSNPHIPIFEDYDVNLFTAQLYSPLKKIGKGVLRLYIDRIEFTPENKVALSFPIEHLNGVSTHLSDRFDFFYKGVFYRASFKDRHVSANKWTEAYDRIIKITSML